MLDASFYTRADVVQVARDLLGKVLCTHVDGRRTCAIITETEAYAGVVDRASHAFGGRRTQRTEPLFLRGGVAYVYLCYGIHHLFNVVTSIEDDPKAVLVRAAIPLYGVQEMLLRREKPRLDPTLLAGPGSLGRALGITTRFSGSPLDGEPLWIEDRGIEVPDAGITAGPRIGIDYAGEDAALPYRFTTTIAPDTEQFKEASYADH